MKNLISNPYVLGTIALNLIIGNLYLFLFEVSSMWMSCSLSSVVCLTLASSLLRKNRSKLFIVLLSLIVSLLIPVLGFLPLGQFTIIIAMTLGLGFKYLVLPLFLMNTFAFMLIERNVKTT